MRGLLHNAPRPPGLLLAAVPTGMGLEKCWAEVAKREREGIGQSADLDRAPGMTNKADMLCRIKSIEFRQVDRPIADWCYRRLAWIMHRGRGDTAATAEGREGRPLRLTT